MMSIKDTSGSGALKGIKVLDIGQSGTILFVTKYLADHGATAVWVESKTHPDVCRLSAPYQGGIVDPNRSAGVVLQNTSKFNIGINIRKPKGADIVKRLAAWADVINSSFAPGVLEKHGLGYEDLRKVNPNAIIVNGSALGKTGPYSAFTAFGFAQKAICGAIEYVGWPDRPGCGPPLAYPDFSAPWLITAAVLAALHYRRRTGKAQYIEFSQVEAALSFIPSHLLLQYAANKEIPTRMGNGSANSVPHGAYPCKGYDRWCVISVSNDYEWESLCSVMGKPAWTMQPEFSTLLQRKRNETELDKLLGAWTVGFEPWELMEKLQMAGVPAGVVEGYDEMIERDPQLKHRGFFVKLSRPQLEDISHPGWPGQLSETPWVMRPTPRIAEHTEAICKEILNMSSEEFTELLYEEVLEVAD